MPSPKLNVAFETVPSVSRPIAVSVTDKGAEPDEVEDERLIQTGDLLVDKVGTAVGETVMVVLGEGDVVSVTPGEGDVPLQVLGVMDSCRPDELPALYTFSACPSWFEREYTFVPAESMSSLITPFEGAIGLMVMIASSVVVEIAFTLSEPAVPIPIVRFIPSGVESGPFVT